MLQVLFGLTLGVTLALPGIPPNLVQRPLLDTPPPHLTSPYPFLQGFQRDMARKRRTNLVPNYITQRPRHLLRRHLLITSTIDKTTADCQHNSKTQCPPHRRCISLDRTIIEETPGTARKQCSSRIKFSIWRQATCEQKWREIFC